MAAAEAQEAPPSFFCPISMDIMRDPVSTVDGHCYERAAIQEWFATGNRNAPKTGQALASVTLTPNHALRNAIELHTTRLPFLHLFFVSASEWAHFVPVSHRYRR